MTSEDTIKEIRSKGYEEIVVSYDERLHVYAATAAADDQAAIAAQARGLSEEEALQNLLTSVKIQKLSS